MSKHTPGPWSVSELDASGEVSEHYIFIEPGVAVIERKIAGHDACDMPDARLIAKAPALLAALQSAADSLAQMALDRNDKELADLALNLRAAARGATE